MTEVIKKKRVNSKAKGNSGERAICKLLSDALAPFKFIRSPGSGAAVGGLNFDKFAHLYSQEAMALFVSDVCCSNEKDTGKVFRFAIESKNYKDAEKLEVLLNGKSNIYKWFEEIKVDAVKINKDPILIFKWNQTPYYVCVDSNIKLPVETILTLPTGLQLCYLKDLLQFKEFWEV
jgi:hypothetical protein